MSPEEFAKRAKLSHMTIRRWLKKNDQEALPAKYAPTLGPLFGAIPAPVLPKVPLEWALKNLSMDVLMAEIEQSGARFKDLKRLESAYARKLKTAPPDKSLLHCVRELLKAAKSPKTGAKARAIAIGALLYFVDPRGASDANPFVAYLGDLAILSVALNTVYLLRSNPLSTSRRRKPSRVYM